MFCLRVFGKDTLTGGGWNRTLVSPDTIDRLNRLLFVLLSVDFRDGCGAVAEDDLGGFDAELLPRLGGGVVVELVGGAGGGPFARHATRPSAPWSDASATGWGDGVIER